MRHGAIVTSEDEARPIVWFEGFLYRCRLKGSWGEVFRAQSTGRS